MWKDRNTNLSVEWVKELSDSREDIFENIKAVNKQQGKEDSKYQTYEISSKYNHQNKIF